MRTVYEVDCEQNGGQVRKFFSFNLEEEEVEMRRNLVETQPPKTNRL